MENNEKLPPQQEEGAEDCSYATEKYIKPRSVGEWLSNFWYHYKLHTIACVVVVALVAVLVGQLSTRVDYDIDILYAGNHKFIRVSESGEMPPYNTATQSLMKICPDLNGDGEINLTFRDFFVPTAEEIEKLKEDKKGDQVNESLIQSDYQDLTTALVSGKYNIIIMSESRFDEFDVKFDGALFADLTPYLKEGAEYEFCGADTRAVYLRSLGIGALPELENMPEDTVICLRRMTVDLSLGTTNRDEKYEDAVEVMRRILSFGK